jgi:hypothetical protein
VLALAAIIAMARRDLNAADFISRGVEGAAKATINQMIAAITRWKCRA